jgi:hypothetical protein
LLQIPTDKTTSNDKKASRIDGRIFLRRPAFEKKNGGTTMQKSTSMHSVLVSIETFSLHLSKSLIEKDFQEL